jgi:hypothetical protein
MILWDILLIIGFVFALIFVGLYFLNQWARKKYTMYSSVVQKTKTATNVFVIKKKRC